MIEALIIYYSVVGASVLTVGGGIAYLIIDDLILINKSNGGRK